MNDTYSPTTTAPAPETKALRRNYYYWLVGLVVAITIGALAGAWIMWDYTGDGSIKSVLVGQSAVFGCAAIMGFGPLLGAVGARRRWHAALKATPQD